mmetsp:Transcript_146876/g.256284  ORF Transcript_146876/g.256284 Transcript_146876/m.256284 type:complete len:273 (-) Transcript_146876:176-994(-)
MGIPESVKKAAGEVGGIVSGAMESSSNVSQALDAVIKNVSKFSESTAAAADEIAAVSSMPVKKAEIVSEVTRKISTVEEETMLIVGSLSLVAQTLIKSGSALLGIAKNSTSALAATFEKLSQDLTKLAHSYANLLIMLSEAANVSLIQAHRQEDPAVCNLVHDTFGATIAHLDNFLAGLDVIETTAHNASSIVAELPTEIKKHIEEVVSKAEMVVMQLRTQLPQAIHKFQDAVSKALAKNVCANWKSSGFRLGHWSMAFCALLWLLLQPSSS